MGRPTEDHLPGILKAQTWETAKGHLRALVRMQGNYFAGDRDHPAAKARRERWKELGEKVESFIKDVEGSGLEE